MPVNEIPRPQLKVKPDWNAPETVKVGNEDYYPSQRAIGKLYRLIDLPALQIVQRAGRSQRRRIRKPENQHDVDILEQFYDERLFDDEVGIVIRQRIVDFIDPDEYDNDFICQIWDLYNSYTSKLQAVCADHTLEHKGAVMLTEEEAVVWSSFTRVPARGLTDTQGNRLEQLSPNAHSPGRGRISCLK